MDEVWKDVSWCGYRYKYQVSNKNGFRRITKNGYVNLKGHITRGYRVVNVGEGLQKQFHRLVARAFPEICGEWFEGCQVHHKDFNKLNNVPDNLIVISASEHSKLHYEHQPDSFKKPSKKRNESIRKALSGRRNIYKHIPILQFTLKGEFIKEWECISDVVLDGFDPSNVCSCCKGNLKTAYGYIWKYK